MEVVQISNTPFQTQVHEWQQHHPSPVAEANPIENHWIKGSFNTYGKMVTNNFLTPDGTKHTQKKQMEILQARTKEGGALQVVKSSTSQSISSRTITSSASTGCDSNTTTSTNRPERPTSLSLSNMTNTRPLSGSFNGWNGSISRGKSQSNEDLAGNANPDKNSDNEINDPWNRVSRIRRSFQYPSPSSSTSKTQVRPVDFPSRSSVDVNKIRQELESICGNGPKVQKSPSGVDSAFVALDSILKGAVIEKPDTKKKQIVTSETLQNIRSSLRRLEDDSLYKDSVLNSPRNSLSMEDDATKVSYSSASPSVRSSFGDWRSKLLSKESNFSNSSLLRRKSYGFECLDDDKMESSTDSGLGGSSPTAERKRNSLLAISKSKLSPTRITLFNDSQHLISLPNNKRNTLPAGSRFDFDGRTSIHISGNTEDECSSQDGILDENGRKSTKRVEFCKTEIHFTPDSGRVNIVETDGKPPSTNNFRRRRRGSGLSVSASSTTTSSSSTTVTSDKQFSRFKENDEIQVAPDLIMNKSSSVDLSPLTNVLNVDDDLSIRGILKNKPIKPRQYHLGENMRDIDSIWGVKLNPIYSGESNDLYRSQEAINSDQKVLKNGDLSKTNGYSTKIDLTFKDESNKWNEGGAPAVKNVLSRSYNSSFVEYKKPVTTDIEPQHDLKSISLVKNTIRLGDSPSKFEIIESEIGHPETNRRSFEFERLSSIRSSGTRSAFAPVTSSSQNKEPSANEKQLKRDLDEAFKDLMNVSATLREMGKNTEITSKPIKQHNTFPSIRSHANNASSHSISTISSGNWSTYSRQSLQYESLSDFGADNCPKTKPIPKPRHSITVASSVSPSSEKSQDVGYDTVDTLAMQQSKNFVKTIQQQFEALSMHHQKNVIPDSNSELNHSNSNKMSIEFYSPINSLDRKERTAEKQKKRPVPMPRTIMSDSEGVVKPSRIVAKSKAFEQLAFKSGARQLKPTELVYFGILSANECMPSNELRTKQQSSSPNSPLLSRNSFTSSSMTSSQRFTESLSRHSTSGLPPVPRERSDVSPVNDYFFKTSFNQRPKLPTPDDDDTDRHHMSDTNGGEMFAGKTSTIERINKFERTIRENLMKNLEEIQRSPKVRTRSEMLGNGLKESSVDDDLGHGYDRSHDYKRDENVLAELTKAADEIMDTVKKMDEDESRRKSRSHRHKQQYMELMDTINEKPTQAERRSTERVIYSPRRITTRECCSSLSSASSQESINNVQTRRSPGRQQINRIPLRRNSSESLQNQKQSSSSTRSSTRDGRRLLRTASREVLNSSSEDLPSAPVKVDAPRRVRRIKVTTEGVREVQSTTTRDSTRERSSRQKPSSSGGSSRRVSSKPQSSQEEKNTSASQKGKVYTHRLKKVDDISMKPSSSSRRQSSKHAKSSTIRSSKTSL